MALTETAKKQALALMKTRLNRTPGETALDDYLMARLEAAEQTFAKEGIKLGDSMNDVLLLVDKAVFDYQNRDKQQGEPDWLRAKRRGRWMG